MTRNDDDSLDLSRRTVMQGTAGLGVLGMAGTAAGRGNPGGGPPSSPPPGDGGDGGGDRVATVTLVTGHTVHVYEDGDDVRYQVDGDAERVRRLETDEGTYVIPDGVDLDRFSPLLFNVDFLVEQGVTDEETDAVPVVVSLDADVEEAAASSMAAGGFRGATALPSIDAVAGEVAKDSARATSQSVLGADVVEQVYLDTRFETLLDTSADAVNAQSARESFDVDGSGTTIAVLDTGIDADHPDFGDRVVHQQDFSGDGVQDGNGHGTHCAGIAAGAGAENGDYVGMAPGADLMAVKVLGDDGSGRLSDIVSGIEHAVDQGADVVSLSLGGSAQEDGPLAEAVNAAVENGVVAAVAAGNDGGYESVATPGLAEKALTVGASDGTDGVAGFSSGGPTPYDYRVKPEVSAPGVEITATGSEDAGEYPYTTKSGTSMSTPHVAGIAALLLEDDPDRTPADVRDALVATADPVEGEDVYRQGAGVVDVEAALGADLRVRDAVANFGLYTETDTDTATVTLENTGSEAVTVTPSAELVNVQSGDSLADNVSVSPSSVTVEAGATETVSVTVDTEDAFGYNSGVLTFETGDGTTHRAIFGFVRGFEVTVDRNAHPENDSEEYSILMAWDHEHSFIHYGFAPFFFGSEEYTFLLLDDSGGFKEGGDFTFWLADQLESGDRVFTVEQTTITPDNTHVTMDETATVPRELDTSQVAEHEPFEMRRFDAGLDAVFPDLAWFSYGDSKTGQHDVNTLYVSPIEESQPTTVSNAYLMYPEAMQGEAVLDSPVVYHLFDGALSIPESGDTVTVDPDELAAETLEFHRPAGDESYSVYPHFYPADSHNHPKYISVAFEAPIGADLAEQTWYRNDQTRYAEDWDAGPARFNRMTDFVPEAGGSYRRRVGHAPFVGRLSEWSVADGSLSLRGHWYADQGEAPFVATNFTGNWSNWNGYSVRVDGDTVDTSISDGVAFTSGDHDLSAGSTVEVSTTGSTFGETAYGTTTTTDYEVTYEAGTANAPPQVDGFAVTGLDRANGVAADQVVAFVDVAHEADGLADATVYYAPSGATSGTPFDDPAGWREADVRYSEGGTLGAVLDVAGYTGRLDVAVSATDADGNAVQATTREALTVQQGAEIGADLDVRPDEIDPGAPQMVPVRIYHGDGLDAGQVDLDSLRFGSHDAVHGGDAAAPVQAKRLGNGDIQVKFRANDTDFACGDGPVAAYVAGELDDSTPISGADVIADVVCDE